MFFPDAVVKTQTFSYRHLLCLTGHDGETSVIGVRPTKGVEAAIVTPTRCRTLALVGIGLLALTGCALHSSMIEGQRAMQEWRQDQEVRRLAWNNARIRLLAMCPSEDCRPRWHKATSNFSVDDWYKGLLPPYSVIVQTHEKELFLASGAKVYDE